MGNRHHLDPRLDPVGLRRQRPRPGTPLCPPEQRAIACLGRGRDALWFVAARCVRERPATVWAPAYGCAQTVIPFARAGLAVRFYDVTASLQPDWARLLAEAATVPSTKVLLVIDYFGFPVRLSDALEPRVATTFDVVVRDSAHMLPWAAPPVVHGRSGGYVVYSLRKLLPVADLAIVTTDDARDPDSVEEATVETGGGTTGRNAAYLWLEVAARMWPALRDRGPHAWARRHLREARLGIGASRLSHAVARASDQHRVVERRRSNAERLRLLLGESALFDGVPPDACPQQFPVVVRDSRAAQRALANGGIEAFAPWTLDHVPDLAHHPISAWLASTVVCVPVHQDLEGADLEAIAAAVQRVIGAGDHAHRGGRA